MFAKLLPLKSKLLVKDSKQTNLDTNAQLFAINKRESRIAKKKTKPLRTVSDISPPSPKSKHNRRDSSSSATNLHSLSNGSSSGYTTSQTFALIDDSRQSERQMGVNEASRQSRALSHVAECQFARPSMRQRQPSRQLIDEFNIDDTLSEAQFTNANLQAYATTNSTVSTSNEDINANCINDGQLFANQTYNQSLPHLGERQFHRKSHEPLLHTTRNQPATLSHRTVRRQFVLSPEFLQRHQFEQTTDCHQFMPTIQQASTDYEINSRYSFACPPPRVPHAQQSSLNSNDQQISGAKRGDLARFNYSNIQAHSASHPESYYFYHQGLPNSLISNMDAQMSISNAATDLHYHKHYPNSAHRELSPRSSSPNKRHRSIINEFSVDTNSINETLPDNKLHLNCLGKLSKFFLFVSNLVFWMTGFALAIWGILTLIEDNKYNLSQLLIFESGTKLSLIQLLSWSFITLGCAAILVGFCGYSAIFKNNRWILSIYIFLILIIFALGLATGLLAMIFQEKLLATVRLKLGNKLRSDYGVYASFTAAIDFIQTKFECCGLDGHFDYEQSLWRVQRLGGFDATVARTCCHLKNTNDDQAHINPRPINESMCQSTDSRFHQSYRFRKGCIDEFEVSFRKRIWHFILACSSFDAIILICVFFATCFCRSISSSTNPKSKQKLIRRNKTGHTKKRQGQNIKQYKSHSKHRKN